MDRKYNYILLLKKSDFVDLFKFGHIGAFCAFVQFDGDLEKVKSNEVLADKLFKQASPFEYSMEYYLVHVCSDRKALKQICIGDVQHIFALDSDSVKVGLELDPPVKLEDPLWPLAYEKFQIGLMQKSAEEGVINTFEAFGLDFDVKRKKFITKKDVATIMALSYQGRRPSGAVSIWIYLLMYERHQYYPKDTRGYFLDALHVWANYLKHQELDIPVSESKLGKKITEMPHNTKFDDLVKFVSMDKNVAKADKLFNGFFKIAALFLLLKNEFQDGMEIDKLYFNHHIPELVPVLERYGIEDLKLSLYLLGLSLGHELTYKYVYQLRKYPFLIKD